MTTLGEALVALRDGTDIEARKASDPVAFAHRYSRPEDIEVAGFFAAQLAFGRVSSFSRPLQALLDEADTLGGPRAWLEGFDPRDPGVVGELGYRWIRADDFTAVTAALRDLVAAHGGIGPAFAGRTAKEALVTGVTTLRHHVLAHSPDGLTRGRQAFLASPADGSACKRWCMYLRWMVRPADGVDFGIWTQLSPADLVIPLDTHVHRIALLVGLTDRKASNWRTAEAITAALRAYSPADPVGFDFALAHLGISGACRSRQDPRVCPTCALTGMCAVSLEGTAEPGDRRTATRS